MSMLKRSPGKWEQTPTHGQKLAKGGIPGNHTKCKIGQITGGINRCPAGGQEEKISSPRKKKIPGEVDSYSITGSRPYGRIAVYKLEQWTKAGSKKLQKDNKKNCLKIIIICKEREMFYADIIWKVKVANAERGVDWGLINPMRNSRIVFTTRLVKVLSVLHLEKKLILS